MILKKIYQKPADNWKNILSFVVWYIYSQYRHKMILLLFWQTEKKPPKTLELIQATALGKKENEDAKKKIRRRN